MPKIKYTITLVREEDPENWGGRTGQELIKEITRYVKDDIRYVMDMALEKMDDKIEVELIS